MNNVQRIFCILSVVCIIQLSVYYYPNLRRLKIPTVTLPRSVLGITFTDNKSIGQKVTLIPSSVNKEIHPRPVVLSVISSFENQTTSNGECDTAVNGVAFIKTHKTGSTTVGHIMNRFGFRFNKSFVLDKNRGNGHLVYANITRDSPRKLFLKSLNISVRQYEHAYDMITVHVRYNREAMDTFMHPETKYITVLRDPGTQFESAFVHFQFDDAFLAGEKNKFASFSIPDKIAQWLKSPDKYLSNLRQLKYFGEKGLRYYYAQNNQIFDLGLDVSWHKNATIVDQYINRLEQELDVVLITEHLEESLLVLKKQFCWKMDDIVFISKNERSERAKNYSIPAWLRQKMREWNSVDVKLYERFNKTLWQKIRSYGPTFYDELTEYRKILNETFIDCVNGTYNRSQGRLFQNVNYKPKIDAGERCRLIAEHKSELMKRIRKRQLPTLVSNN